MLDTMILERSKNKNARRHSSIYPLEMTYLGTHYIRDIASKREKTRKCFHSDLESDNGSDGVAVNSGGSGGAGDWKSPYSTRINNNNKNKSIPFTLSSTNQYGDRNSDFNYQPNVKRASSCAALSVRNYDEDESSAENRKSIEEKENEILRQCYANAEGHNNVVVDCSEFHGAYIYKPTKPGSKMKRRLKKLKLKKRNDAEEPSSSTISSDMSYMEYVHKNEEDKDVIMSRLSSSPSKKPFFKKLFSRLGGKTYSTQNVKRSEKSNHSPKRTLSTQSIPGLLKSENHFSYRSISKASSLPSIANVCSRADHEIFQTSYFHEQFSPIDAKNNLLNLSTPHLVYEQTSAPFSNERPHFFDPNHAYASHFSQTDLRQPSPPNYYHPAENYYHVISPQDYVIAPLNVQVSRERKAQRRKVSEMVFDTFV